MGWRSSKHGYGLGLRISHSHDWHCTMLCYVCRTISISYHTWLYIACIFLIIVPETYGYGTTKAAFDCTGQPLGMEDGTIGDDQISTSSEWDSYHAATNARLNFIPQGDVNGAWTPSIQDQAQWIQVDLLQEHTITGVILQGRETNGDITCADNPAPTCNQWVTKFKVLYGLDGKNFKAVADGNNDAEFDGNTDSRTPVENVFYQPVTARYIRINPREWNYYISMRFELLGCIKDCTGQPLGMEDGTIGDDQISTSSEWDSDHAATNARLNFIPQGDVTGAWTASIQDQAQWIQVDLLQEHTITGVILQGRETNGDITCADNPAPTCNQWVTKFKVLYGLDGKNFKAVADGNNDAEFDGNTDSRTPVENVFYQPVTARYIRINPLEWNNYISMRFELLGCIKERIINLYGYDDYQGVVEVYVDGEWGAICADGFGYDEANVVCRQLGYYSHENNAEAYFTYAATKYNTHPYDTIFYKDLTCVGYENYVEDCDYTTKRDYICGVYNVVGVRCVPNDNDINSDDSPFEGVLGYMSFFIFVIVFVALVATRRYRQRRSLCGNNVPQTNQTQVVYNGNNVQGIAVPPPRPTSHQAPPGSYPTQQQINQYPPAADLPPQYSTVVHPHGNPGVPPSAGAPSYPPQSTPYPPQVGGIPYPPQSGTSYPPAQPYPQTTASATDNTTSPAFPPSDYTPVIDDSTPYMPPPSYDSVVK